MLITINPIDSLILFHGQQENVTYQYLESGISTDSTIHFIFGEDRIKDSFSFSWINQDKGVGVWDLSSYYLGNEQLDYNFVSKAQQNNFTIHEQPCRECWDDEFCNNLEPGILILVLANLISFAKR